MRVLAQIAQIIQLPIQQPVILGIGAIMTHKEIAFKPVAFKTLIVRLLRSVKATKTVTIKFAPLMKIADQISVAMVPASPALTILLVREMTTTVDLI
jgi:hypothetical protein